MRKDDLMCTYFKTETEKHSIGRNLIEKIKCQGTGLVSGKMEPLHAELNKRMDPATSNYSATGEFLQYIYSVLVAKNHQKIRSRCLVHKFSVADIFLNFVLCVLWLLIAVMQRCTEQCILQLYRTSLSIFILFQLQSWIILRVRTKFLLRNFYAESDYGGSDGEDIKQLCSWHVK